MANRGAFIVMLGTHGSMSLAISEGEALEPAEPDNGDSFFSIEQLNEGLSEPLIVD